MSIFFIIRNNSLNNIAYMLFVQNIYHFNSPSSTLVGLTQHNKGKYQILYLRRKINRDTSLSTSICPITKTNQTREVK